MKTDDQIAEYFDLEGTDISEVDSVGAVVSVTKTNLYLNGVDLETNHESVESLHIFFRFIQAKYTTFSIEDSNIDMSGQVGYSPTQFHISFKNVDFDFWRGYSGFFLDMSCSSTEDIFDGSVTAENINLYLSRTRVENLASAIYFLRANTAGNVYVTNYNSYIGAEVSHAHWFTYLDDDCNMGDADPPVVNYTNVYATPSQYSTRKFVWSVTYFQYRGDTFISSSFHCCVHR